MPFFTRSGELVYKRENDSFKTAMVSLPIRSNAGDDWVRVIGKLFTIPTRDSNLRPHPTMTSASPHDRRSGSSPPQFRLRTLMLFVAAICVSLALMRVIGAYGSAVLILVLLSIFAHVAGNALGTKLRDQRKQRSSHEAGDARPLTESDFAPTTRLSRGDSLGITIVVVVCVGAVGGASIGAYLLYQTLGDKATVANMSLGITAFAIIGGFAGFLTSTFLKVLIGANIEAWRNGKGP